MLYISDVKVGFLLLLNNFLLVRMLSSLLQVSVAFVIMPIFHILNIVIYYHKYGLGKGLVFVRFVSLEVGNIVTIILASAPDGPLACILV